MDLTYQYKAVNGSGKEVESSITASSKDAAVSLIKARGEYPIHIGEAKQQSMDVKDVQMFKKKVKLPHLSAFCKQMATMLKAGLQLDKALTVLIAQTESKVLREAVMEVSLNVKQGMPLSKSMLKQPEVFPMLLINMIEAGELTGDMDGSLERMSTHYEKEHRTSHKVKSAMMYPMILFFLTIAIALGMIIFILPTFAGMLADGGNEMPGLTQALMDFSTSMKNQWYLYIIGMAGIGVGVTKFLKSPVGRQKYDRFLLNFFIIKKPMAQIITARFTRTLSSLLGSGIPILKALAMASETTNNSIVTTEMEDVIEEMKQGSTLGVQLQKLHLFPQMMISMITIGEETGSLEDLLLKTADYYDEELDAAISQLVAALEPLMIIFMAAIIGVVVIAMYLPMFELATGGGI